MLILKAIGVIAFIGAFYCMATMNIIEPSACWGISQEDNFRNMLSMMPMAIFGIIGSIAFLIDRAIIVEDVK